MIADNNNVANTASSARSNTTNTKSSNAISIPQVNLPKGGGALRGIDEKFSVNAVNGTGFFSIPLPFSPSRGVNPSLSLSYNSGSGNGIFGLGWNLNLSSIKRKTANELPQYVDALDSDTFQLSEAEDLVPEFAKYSDGNFRTNTSGEYIIKEIDSPDGSSVIRYYRPRIEGMFARIERWTHKHSGEIKWRLLSGDNTTTFFGWSAQSRIVDPADDSRTFEWLPEFIFDDKGNCAHYIYKQEDSRGFNESLLHHRNRIQNGKITYTNRYLEKVLYGNRIPYKVSVNSFPPESDYLFSTLFDYGEYNEQSPYGKIEDWVFRPDAFSDYKAGFEIRTTRLCKRVMLFHHFSGVGEYDGLVSSLNFGYETNSEADFTFLKSVTSFGYIKEGESYSAKKLPPIEFEYQKHEWNKEIKSIDIDQLVHAPSGLDESQYQFIDLFNEGLAGILTEQASGWHYKHNLGNGQFDQAKLITPKPSFTGLGSELHLNDLNADGGRQLVNLDIQPRGYFELDDENEWQRFQAFKTMPNIDLGDSNTRLLDLNGDGRPEVVISEEQVFTWYASDGRNGYKAAQKTQKTVDEEKGPGILFSDPMQTIFLADMSGNGMTDIVRIRNGEICYWPNLGYGKFGAKIAMDNAPRFDYTDSFNPAYLRLADIDGSGTTDIIYLGKNKFSCWKNRSGNSFSNVPFEIDSFPEVHSHAKVTVVDLLGNGVACIAWSSPLPKNSAAPIKYIDLMNSKKPHIMVTYKNNVGKEVSMEYVASTKFYLEDKKNGRPWVTKLHFPVHCISKTITEDRISGYRFVSEYKYHHGYYDHAEREFRGFGMVEQIDAETFEGWRKGNASNIVEEPLHQEPVVSKSWFHTGAFLGKERILNQFQEDYWYAEMERQGFPITHLETTLPDAKLIGAPGLDASILEHLSTQEWQEALRACKGMGLRSEIFTKDAAKYGNTVEARKRELIPYTVSTHNGVIELLQPKGNNKHAVFVMKESEAVTYSYERNPEDPRIAHSLNIRLDEYGNVLESAAVVYPRLIPDSSLPTETQQQQNKTVIIYTKNQFTNDIITGDTYRLRLPSEVKTYELKGVAKEATLYAPADFKDILSDAKSDTALYHEIEKPVTAGKAQKRLIENIRTNYLKNDLSGPLPLHRLEFFAFPYENYQLAYTPELLTDIYAAKADDHVLRDLMDTGKFCRSIDGDGNEDTNWWIRSGTVQFIRNTEPVSDAQDRFWLPISYTDPYGAVTKVEYGNYFLFIAETEDALGNKSKVVTFNFRTLSPVKMKDVNGNFSEAISDELGIVKAIAVMGKGDEADELTGLEESTSPSEIDNVHDFFNAQDSVQLRSLGKSLLQRATTRFVYDLEAYVRHGKPAVVAAISREKHFHMVNDDDDTPVQIAFEYCNGIGEVIMQKAQAEPGKAKELVVHHDNSITIRESDTSSSNPQQLRWIGNGRSIKNNKGNTVKQYEPYFSLTHRYEDAKELVETGVTPMMFYDALGRLIKTEMPDGTFSKVEWDSWKQVVYDANDTVLDNGNTWYSERINSPGNSKEKQAAQKAAQHANTPTVLHFDTLGRNILSIDRNKNPVTQADEFYHTKLYLDTEGNLRSVTDARNNTVMQYKHDMVGNMVYQNSMDAGRRWLLVNILGNSLRTWDERDHEFQYTYDALHRPLESRVINAVGNTGDQVLNNIFNRVVYGESLLLQDRSNEAELQARNILGQSIQLYDTGGLVDSPEFDFKGKPLAVTRRLFGKYKEVVDWTDLNLAADLESESYTFSTETDALGRITRQTVPDGSVITPVYNEAGLLDGENVQHTGDATPNTYIRNIDYNEKGQRSKITYGNDVITSFEYDLKTFRLKRLFSRRHNSEVLQDLHYTYDPVGNITAIEDKAIPISFFNNSMIEPLSEYTYDSLYRIVEATGRENIAALQFDENDNCDDRSFMLSVNPGDPMAVRNYMQRYQYDEAGNIKEMKHIATGNNWTRKYRYETTNNRLDETTVGEGVNQVSYAYPHHAQHGFITAMPHLVEMGWNFIEELVKTIRQKVNPGNGTAETTYYQYDGGGQRIRKITENEASAGNTATKKEERIYMDGYELYKKHSGPHAGLERTSLSLMDGSHRFAMIETRNDVDDGTEQELVRYQLHNHLGSASLELDDTARLISYEEYHPYGTTAYQAKNRSIKSAAKRYRYTGMERDEETGLEYHSARYYLPWLGRWSSCDPLGIVDGLNMQSFVQGNPIRFLDPSGTDSKHPEMIKPSNDYTVRNNPEKFFGENLNARTNWNNAYAQVLESEFGMKDFRLNQAKFNQHIDSLDDGPQQIGKRINLKSKAGFARRFSSRVLSRFYVNESKSPSWGYSDDQKKILAKGKAPDPLQQLEHMNNLANEPKKANDIDNLYFTEGGRKGGVPKESPHGQKNWGETGRRLKEFWKRMSSSIGSQAKKVGGGSSNKGGLMATAVMSVGTLFSIASQIANRDYLGAIESGVTTALGFTRANPVAFAYGIAKTYHGSPQIQNDSYKDGQWWEEATGSRIVGGVARALSAIGRSALEQFKMPLSYQTERGGKRFTHFFDGTIIDDSGKVIYMRRW